MDVLQLCQCEGGNGGGRWSVEKGAELGTLKPREQPPLCCSRPLPVRSHSILPRGWEVGPTVVPFYRWRSWCPLMCPALGAGNPEPTAWRRTRCPAGPHLRPTLPCSPVSTWPRKTLPHLLPKLPSASDNNNKRKAQRI